MALNKSSSISIVTLSGSLLVRKGVKAVLENTDSFHLLDETGSLEEVEEVFNKQTPQVWLIDYCCNECFPLKSIIRIKSKYKDVGILLISHERSIDQTKRIISAGIKNYLLKDCNEDEITDAVKSCAKGEKYFCRQIIDMLLEREISANDSCETGSITQREMEIIKQLVAGKRPKEISDILNISYHTIITHKKNVYKKLGISNNMELMQYAVKSGLLS